MNEEFPRVTLPDDPERERRAIAAKIFNTLLRTRVGRSASAYALVERAVDLTDQLYKALEKKP